MVDAINANWVYAVTLLSLLAVLFLHFRDVLLSTRRALRQWLLWAVAHAEYELGPEMGELKLAKVYEMFAARFPWVARFLSFCHFEGMVRETLYELEEMGVTVVMTKNGKEFCKLEDGDWKRGCG